MIVTRIFESFICCEKEPLKTNILFKLVHIVDIKPELFIKKRKENVKA